MTVKVSPAVPFDADIDDTFANEHVVNKKLLAGGLEIEQLDKIMPVPGHDSAGGGA